MISLWCNGKKITLSIAGFSLAYWIENFRAKLNVPATKFKFFTSTWQFCMAISQRELESNAEVSHQT